MNGAFLDDMENALCPMQQGVMDPEDVSGLIGPRALRGPDQVSVIIGVVRQFTEPLSFQQLTESPPMHGNRYLSATADLRLKPGQDSPGFWKSATVGGYMLLRWIYTVTRHVPRTQSHQKNIHNRSPDPILADLREMAD
jgi:hypothetical protein